MNLKIISIAIVTSAMLVACSNDEEANSESPDKLSATDKSEQDDHPNSSGLVERNDDMTEANGSPNLGNGETEDQLDLKIGDTGIIETTIATFAVTIYEARIEKSIEDEEPDRENFVLVDVSLENLSDSEIDIRDSLDVLELTGDLEGSGGPDFSHLSDVIETMEGTLDPGETVKGNLLFEADEFETYYIRVREGLVAASASKNQTIWTFIEKKME
ncbi:DUF4352 domain-containing protein [Alkalicoccobacillus gibsonii]|uniref:DUF4352 domain-containing protein n=1 Tax=Alkalicoccobacillus gibsonii TaxID=79881 RepID=UPI00351853CD